MKPRHLLAMIATCVLLYPISYGPAWALRGRNLISYKIIRIYFPLDCAVMTRYASLCMRIFPPIQYPVDSNLIESGTKNPIPN